MRVCVRVYDKRNYNDPVKDQQCSKAGDVIEVQPDGFVWRPGDLENRDLRFVDLPGVDPTTWADMVEPYLDLSLNPEGNPRATLLLRRKKWIDFATYPNVLTYLLGLTGPTTLNTPNRNALNNARAFKPVPDQVVVG